ncbi:hypothetical protein [Aestuariibaculum marinum]|uniref:Uncharacterized protein n=1 Tax=Aestuariibaculum marinum TaxID=2683592 RepID=A0A8J6PQJ4_9FLAO|nr:hypothetical protein [Aestuariibaculum marinum]MBD0822622.1 hypothetical protein [Aestuariibaculum marinum]
MSKAEDIIFFIKFGQKKYLELLKNKGELYFKNAKFYNQIKKSNNEQGDENEGAIWIENLKNYQLTLSHPEYGELKFKSVPNQIGKLTQFNHNYLITSFYSVSKKDFSTNGTLKISNKMTEMGDHALIILDTKKFLDSVLKSAKNIDIPIIGKKVEYHDLSNEGRIDMSPFHKKNEHSYQNEFRIIIENSIEEFKILSIDELSNNGIIIPVPKNQPLEFKID